MRERVSLNMRPNKNYRRKQQHLSEKSVEGEWIDTNGKGG